MKVKKDTRLRRVNVLTPLVLTNAQVPNETSKRRNLRVQCDACVPLRLRHPLRTRVIARGRMRMRIRCVSAQEQVPFGVGYLALLSLDLCGYET